VFKEIFQRARGRFSGSETPKPVANVSTLVVVEEKKAEEIAAEQPQPEIIAPSRIKEAISRPHNPFASFGNAEHPASRKELANVLALLICHLGDWRDLGANEFEVAHSIGRLIDSFEPPSVPDK